MRDFGSLANLGKASVLDAWPESDGEALHTSTFLGHPVGCAMALESMRLQQENGSEGELIAGGNLTLEDVQVSGPDGGATATIRLEVPGGNQYILEGVTFSRGDLDTLRRKLWKD